MSFNLSQLGDLTAFSDGDDFEISGKKFKNISISRSENNNNISPKKAKKKKKLNKKSKSKLEILQRKGRDSDTINTDDSLVIRARSIQDQLNQTASDSESLFSFDGKGNGENHEHLESDDSSIPPGQPEPKHKAYKGVDSRTRHIEDALLESDSSLIKSSQKIKVKKIRHASGKRKAECDVFSQLSSALADERVTPNKKRKRDSGRKTTHPVSSQCNNKNSRSESERLENVDGFHLSHQPSNSTKKTKEKAGKRTHQISSQSDSDAEEDVHNFFLSKQISKSKRKTKEKSGKTTHQMDSQSDSPAENVQNFFLSHQLSKSIKTPNDKSAATVGDNRDPEDRPESLESDSNKDDDSQVTPSRPMRYKAGPEMKEVVFDSDELYLEDLGPDDQLWLLRVPPAYKTKNLCGKAVAIGEKCKIKNRLNKVGPQYCWEVKADVNNKMEKSNMTCLLPSKKDKKLHVAGPVNGEISVTKSYCVKPYVIPPVVKKLVPRPEGLKLRNIAFGADNPSTSITPPSVRKEEAASSVDDAELKPKKKKKKKKKHSMQDESSITGSNDEVIHKKKKKKTQ